MIGRGMLRHCADAGTVRRHALEARPLERQHDRRARRPRCPAARVAVPGGLGLVGVLVFLAFQLLSGGSGYRGPERVRRRRAGARRRRDPRRPGPRARPARLQRVRVRLRAAQLGADVRRRLPGREALPLPRRGLDRAAARASSAVGPFYCPADQRVYLDLSFFGDMERPARRAGRLRVGLRDRARGRPPRAEPARHERRGAAPAARGPRPGQPALGAARAAGRLLRGRLGALRVRPARRRRRRGGDPASEAVGDDRLQRRATGEVRPDSFTHGTSEQRAKWFRTGQSSGQPGRLRHVLRWTEV